MSGNTAKTVIVQYFALLKEERGTGREELVTEAATVGVLFEDLRKRHNFSLDKARVRVAVNDKFQAWDAPLCQNDKVVFIPPVAGG